jgi:hypothetical protein
VPDLDPHANCDTAARAYQQVTCDRCGHTYQCTPSSDFYCAAAGDHCCESCLLGGLPLHEVLVDPEVSPHPVIWERPS